MSIRNKLATGVLTCLIASATFSVSTPARASDAGAFIGGVFATKLLSNVSRRTDAEEAQATAAQQQTRSVPTASSAQKSPEQRIKQLDKLAAGGYITPAEYKQKKKAIIDSM
ncbi:MAG: SHOCT domain-containing protein [Gammaproteobacteria bacterium]|nr:SHOCT domain-containing protein [Gammaproteobacteria bacterium]